MYVAREVVRRALWCRKKKLGTHSSADSLLRLQVAAQLLYCPVALRGLIPSGYLHEGATLRSHHKQKYAEYPSSISSVSNRQLRESKKAAAYTIIYSGTQATTLQHGIPSNTIITKVQEQMPHSHNKTVCSTSTFARTKISSATEGLLTHSVLHTHTRTHARTSLTWAGSTSRHCTHAVCFVQGFDAVAHAKRPPLLVCLGVWESQARRIDIDPLVELAMQCGGSMGGGIRSRVMP